MEQRELDTLLNRHEGNILRSGEPVELNLKAKDLRGCEIKDKPRLNGLDLGLANLEGVSITNCNLNGVSFAYAHCNGISIQNSYLNGASFIGTSMENARIIGCEQSDARTKATPVDFRNAWLAGSSITHSDFSGASFEGTKLNRTYLRFFRADHADFRGADLSRCETMHASIKESNCIDLRADHAFFRGMLLDGSNLTGSDLSMSIFTGGDAGGTSGPSSLKGVTLHKTNLHGTDFYDCDFNHSKAESTTFDHSVFDDCSFRNVKFANSNFSYSRFTTCSLMQTVFLHSVFTEAVFDNCYSLKRNIDNEYDSYGEKTEETWDKVFPRALIAWGAQSFYSTLLDFATLDKVNSALRLVGQKGHVEFGASNKLKWVDYGPDRLFNPHRPGESTEGRIYMSMIGGVRDYPPASMPDKNYRNAQSDVITPSNLDSFSVGNILYAIYWLREIEVEDS